MSVLFDSVAVVDDVLFVRASDKPAKDSDDAINKPSVSVVRITVAVIIDEDDNMHLFFISPDYS